ncbi:MAG: serine/threonine protein kinase, partial [Planctomycetota bacterium]
MAIKITFDSFLAVLKRSSLLSEEQLNALLEKFRAANGNTSEGKPFAEFLVRQKILTVWQAEKLLQGKHKGFFLGRYRLLSLLGKGGMSSVYLAEHTVMKRRCALKVLPAKRVSDASYLGRFHREAQAVASLDHPNIVRAYDVDMTTDGGVDIHFLSMEFVQGKSLLEIVQAHGPVSAREAAEYVRQSARGLEHAHHAGLVHRDIKPGNLLLSPEGIIKVLDLGLARFFNEEEGSLTVEHDEKVLGTADYISPEQAIDSHTVDHRTDIYSLGCTLYFLLSGHPPYNTGALHQRLIAHQTKPVPPLPPERTDIPESLVAIMHKMMAKKVEDRYASAAQVAETLAAWLADTSTAETSIAGAIPPAIAKVPAATVLATAAKPLPSKPASAVSPVSA